MVTLEGPIEPVDAESSRTLFRGFYPPSPEERENAYKSGLVSLDANALLDLYRFTPRARDELFEVLELLRERLLITHQVALEFHRNRLSVFDDRTNVSSDECLEIEKHLLRVSERVRAFSNRHQLSDVDRDGLIAMVSSLSENLKNEIMRAAAYDLSRDQVMNATDAVLVRLDSLLEGRVGKDLSVAERREAIKEASRRRIENIPPGFADEKKGDIYASAGDYLMWRQLLNEAKSHGRPVLLVSNERKDDWVRKSKNGEVLGPRNELVIEMKSEAGVQLHTVTVVGLLKEARAYLGAEVSSSTIREAESLPVRTEARVLITDTARRGIEQLASHERGQCVAFLHRLASVYGQEFMSGEESIQLGVKGLRHREEQLFEGRWSADGRVLYRVTREDELGENGSTRVIIVLTVGKYGETGIDDYLGNDDA